MRCLLEVISAEVESREFVNKKSGEIEAPSVLVIYALDKDYPSTMLKVQIWEKFEKIFPDVMRGAVLEVKFRTIRPADGKYEKVDSLSVAEDNIRVVKSAADALKELAAQLQKRSNGSGQLETAAAVSK